MALASYDTLTITINADSKEANKSIRQLSNNLNKLNESATKLNTRRLGEVKGLLLNIAKIDFSNVSKGLQDVVSAFKYFNNQANLKRNSKTSPFSFIQGMSNNFLKEMGIDKVAKSFENLDFSKSLEASIEPQIDKYKELRAILKDLHLSASQTNTIFNALGMNINSLSEEKIQAVGKALQEAGKSTEEIAKVMKALREEIQELEETTGKTGNQFAKMFKNILKYRVVRRLIQSIFQEITQAFQDLANIDEGFNQSFGEITSAFSYIGRTLVSVIAPIIKAIAPIITMIAESIGQVANMLGSTIAGSLGQEFYQAEESVESYTDSVKKAKSITLGIDELNVIDQEKNNGFSLGQAKTMSGELGELMAKISASVQMLLKELTPQIQMLVYSIIRLLEKGSPILIDIIDLTTEFIALTDDSVNTSLSMFIEMLGEIFHTISLLLKFAKPSLVAITGLLALGLNQVNYALEKAFYFVGIIMELLTTIGDTIYYAFTGDFNSIKKVWVNFLNDIVGNTINVIYSLLNPIIQVIENVINVAIDYINQMIRNINGVIGKVSGGRWQINEIPTIDTSGISYSKYNPTYNYNNFGDLGKDVEDTINGWTNKRSNQNIVINIDGREIAKVMTNQQNNFGASIIKGGNIVYGK